MKRSYFFTIALLLAALDQISKYLVMTAVPYGSSRAIIGDWICLSHTQNSGGAFGIFPSFAHLLTVVTLAVILAITIFAGRKPVLPLQAGFALAFLLGGGIGNFVDRIRFDYVVDFIDTRIWPVFNIADSGITVGIALLVYYLIFGQARQPSAICDCAPKE